MDEPGPEIRLEAGTPARGFRVTGRVDEASAAKKWARQNPFGSAFDTSLSSPLLQNFFLTSTFHTPKIFSLNAGEFSRLATIEVESNNQRIAVRAVLFFLRSLEQEEAFVQHVPLFTLTPPSCYLLQSQLRQLTDTFHRSLNITTPFAPLHLIAEKSTMKSISKQQITRNDEFMNRIAQSQMNSLA